MSHISYSESSSSSARSVDIHASTHGFQYRCYCGAAVSLVTKTSGKNIGRLFYKCQNANASGTHIEKWWDATVFEEIEAMRIRAAETEDRVLYLTRGPNDEHIDPRMMWAQLGHHTQSITTLKEKVEDAEDMLEILRSRNQWSVVRVVASALLGRATNISLVMCLGISVLAFIVALFK